MTTTAELVAAIMAAIDDLASASDDRERRRHRRALVRLVEELEARANDAARQLEERVPGTKCCFRGFDWRASLADL
ncbi:unnamed protein product [Clonostachys chloroleuca]|uniref:Uncharacterized protein n=1 Tax=Clonostachys chloroleuca TaxID=1926264 RepID=A0AA35LW62_9HYPO|nr:unnamed protein product [Clonostachys chloroleuca]